MPNLATTLKQEISRLARRELRREVEGLRKAANTYRSEIAALKRSIAELRMSLKTLSRHRAGNQGLDQGVGADAATSSKIRFRASGLATNRKRLELSLR